MSAEVHQIPERYQAECDRCGWHTREAEGGDGKRWANTMAVQHDAVCPNPRSPMNGAVMSCGCWYNAMPGSRVGETTDTCPLHGLVVMVEAKVPEWPEGERVGNVWRARSEGDTTP